MNRLICRILFFTLFVGFAGCAKQPVSYPNTPEEQRDHADQAHRELSTEVRK